MFHLLAMSYIDEKPTYFIVDDLRWQWLNSPIPEGATKDWEEIEPVTGETHIIDWHDPKDSRARAISNSLESFDSIRELTKAVRERNIDLVEEYAGLWY